LPAPGTGRGGSVRAAPRRPVGGNRRDGDATEVDYVRITNDVCP
jgi:hypothetical protein